jgi:YidC/Oxa1 family membrane protein insertase
MALEAAPFVALADAVQDVAADPSWFDSCALACPAARAAPACALSFPAQIPARITTSPTRAPTPPSLIVLPMEFSIKTIHGVLQGFGVEGAYGIAIISFTLLLKGLTLPLNKAQIESTSKMQAIQPAAKALQDKYKDRDPARLNQELQALYQDNQVNPLAGCLPAFAQIPLFIGLYRSLLNLAKEDALEEPFLWLPSLEGPTPDYTQGVKWLTEGWSNGAPALGWHDTLCYLVLPVLLVASQYISTSILTPKPTDESQQQNQAILKFLPLMIGWFSLSVPSGLGLYWLVNNVVTTATTVLIRGGIPTLEVASAGGPATAVDPPKPQGFGRKFGEAIDVSSAEGATVTITPPGAGKRAERRAAAKAAGAAEEVPAVEATTMVADAPAAEAEVTPADVRLSAEAMGASPATSAAPKKTRKKKKTVKRKK